MGDIPEKEFKSRLDHIKTNTHLSDREAQTIAYKSFNLTAERIAQRLNIEPSTVNEYIRRAKLKGIQGKQTYDVLHGYGMVSEDSTQT